MGFFHRKRGLTTSGIVKLISTGIIQATWENLWATGMAAIAFGVIWGLLLYDRWLVLARCDDKRTLHDFCHWLRDASFTRPSKPTEVAPWMESFSNTAAQFTAYHFRATLNDPSVTCAIRLAKHVDGKEAFYTMGRSDRMDPNRSKKTKPIPRDKGIARTLMDKDSQGIWIIPDIKEAIRLAMWEKTDNDELEDLKYVMVGPINAYESGSKAMLGILYVCSRRRRFEPLDTIEMRAWADMLGLAYAEARATLSSV